MRILVAVLAAAASAAQGQPVTERAARSYVASAFITGAEPAILSREVDVAPALRKQLRLAEHASPEAVYRALIGIGKHQPIHVARGTVEPAAPDQAAFTVEVGSAVRLVVRYDLRSARIAYVGLPQPTALADVPTAVSPPAAPAPAAPAPAAPAPIAVALPPVLFEFNSAMLDAGGQALLEAGVAERLPHATRIRLTGHADALGPEAYNLHLSGERAEAVRERLVALGMDASRIELTAAGSEPMHDCADVAPLEAKIACLARDRRVDILVELAPR